MEATMTAVVADDYGPPETLATRAIPIPEPGPGQIQVRLRAAALNPADVVALSGTMRAVAELDFPHVPGSDFAGTVTKTGPGAGPGAGRFAVGDEVFGMALPRGSAALAAIVSSPPSLTTGTLAEYAVFDADTPAVALRPPALPAEHAAALALVGLTALPLLRQGRFAPGEKVLVIGATGGTGSAVLPVLAEAGVHLIATSTPTDEEAMRALGAAEVIDHRATDLLDETLRRYPDGIDALVNLALPGTELPPFARAIRPGGRLLNIAHPAPDPADFDLEHLTVETLFTHAEPGDLDTLAAKAVTGTLPVSIGRRYKLADAARAYTDLRNDHTRGKWIVHM
ncbi:NADP-dependent oxidoreductase [Streptomyces sp. NBC_00370]|uniref:NADP-dependent oxidoreductase n=1 Tax=Streptomyces sp. NBC_00370 TaxID=2975728 RepID=UPI002E26DD14